MLIPRWLYPLIGLLGLACLWSISYRFRVEQENGAVAIAAEFDTIEELSASQGWSVDKALEDLKAQGLNAVVLNEQYVSDLVAAELVQMTPVGDGFRLDGPIELLQRIEKGLMYRYPRLQQELLLSNQPSLTVHRLISSLVRRTTIGLDPAESAYAKSHGMMIISRHSNPSGAGESYVVKTVEWAREMGSEVFLPQGDQVLGRRDALEALERTLARLKMSYASAEFARIGGDQNVVEAAPELVVRLHAAQSQELDKLPLGEAVDRYVRAAKERNQRILLLRPVSFASSQPLSAFAEFAKEVRDGVVASGYQIAKPHPFSEPAVPKPAFMLIGLLAAPIVWWVGAAFVTDRRIRTAGAILAALLVAACWFNTGRQTMALAAAIALPTAAFLILDRRQGKSWPVEFALMSLISFVGGLCVAGLLNGLPYYVRADQFMGVKAAHFIPIGLIGFYFFARQANVMESLRSPMRWLQAGLAFVSLGVLVLMFLRTGNDNPAAVSGLEVKFREFLDTILLVRPRTKEFLIGHPALIIAIGMMILSRTRVATRGEATARLLAAEVNTRGKTTPRLPEGDEALASGSASHPSRPYQTSQPSQTSPWIPLLMMIGAIGQTSMVNTMCHLHTPLLLSLERLGVGFLAGGILGAILWAVVRLRVLSVMRNA